MEGKYTEMLGKFTQCPECKHISYYPFPDGMMCTLCEHSGPLPETEEQPLSKNQRRKANQRARREAAKNGVDS